jgi:ankyrin repeat protein
MSVCSICYECTGKGKVILGCSHEYHLQCITIWLSQKGGRTCPLCRYVPDHTEQIFDLNKNPITSRMVRGVTPLMFAATNNDVEQVKHLVLRGDLVNSRDGDGDSALVYSVSNRHEEVTRCLLDAGADLYPLGKLVGAPETADGALAAATAFYSPSCVNILLQHKVSREGINIAYELATIHRYNDIAYSLLTRRKTMWWPW